MMKLDIPLRKTLIYGDVVNNNVNLYDDNLRNLYALKLKECFVEGIELFKSLFTSPSTIKTFSDINISINKPTSNIKNPYKLTKVIVNFSNTQEELFNHIIESFLFEEVEIDAVIAKIKMKNMEENIFNKIESFIKSFDNINLSLELTAMKLMKKEIDNALGQPSEVNDIIFRRYKKPVYTLFFTFITLLSHKQFTNYQTIN